METKLYNSEHEAQDAAIAEGLNPGTYEIWSTWGPKWFIKRIA